MSSGNIVRECNLADGVTAFVHDDTSHYYGGYYHVRLLITADFPLCSSWFDSEPEYQDAVRRLGSTLCFKRTLEKMAVPSSEVEAVRTGLLESFETNVLNYLNRPDFPRRFVLSEYEKACKTPASSAYYRS